MVGRLLPRRPRRRDGLGRDRGGRLPTFGPPEAEDLTLARGGPLAPPLHLAFAAQNLAEVEGFYREGLAAGGTDNGAPGVRERYSPTYFGAFLLDPDGHNVEAVWHAPPGSADG